MYQRVRSKNKFLTHYVPLDKNLIGQKQKSGNLRLSLKKYSTLILPNWIKTIKEYDFPL